MLSEDQLRFAVEDARVRHEALIQLIYFADTQAMSLLSLFSTVGIAAGSATAAGFATEPVIPFPIAMGLGGAALILLIGTIYCLMAMQTTRLSLPGRGAEFWIWAMHDKISAGHAFAEYFKNLEAESKRNQATNVRSASQLGKAKLCAALAPLAALGFGLLSYGFGT